jgi:hypothetical protein
MRFMVMIKANHDTENGVLPKQELLAAMGKYNEELVKAGIMQAGEGLKPTSEAVRMKFSGSKRTVVNGPFPLSEVYCGFWIWNVKSKEEAIEWLKKCPNPTGADAEIDLRPFYEAEDLGAEFTPELRQQEERLRQQIEKQQKAS